MIRSNGKGWFMGLQAKLTLTFFVVAVMVAGFASLALFHVARGQIIDDLRQRLGDIVSVSANMLDGDLHDRITQHSGMGSAPYREMKAKLQGIRDSASDLYFVYTMRLDENGVIRFGVDAEENPDDMAVLGEVYDDASETLRTRFVDMDGPVVEPAVYTDEWGTWLSGYAPVRRADGSSAGVLGIDISAATIRAYENRLVKTAGGILAACIPFILLVGYGFGRAISRPIIAMERGAVRIGQGDLTVRLDIDRRDEIGTLGRTLDHMAVSLEASRSELSHAVARFRNIFDNAAEGIFQIALDGQVVAANKALLEMIGFETLEDLQRDISVRGIEVFIDSQDRQALREHLDADGRVGGFEAQLRRCDGGLFWADISLRRAVDADGATIIEGMVLDQTERRERQTAEREREAARAASEAKSNFLANMSHEIRTPLNAVMGLTDLVLRTDLDSRQRDFLQKAKVSSRSLLSVINDILDFSKIEAGQLVLEETAFSLHEVTANLSEMFAFQAHEKDIELIVSIDKAVSTDLIGDPVRLGQILINLTGNAIKFTERGEVAVLIDRAPDEGSDLDGDCERLRFTVRDTGPGIPAERIDAIFESFSQADGSITRKYGGTGLGLAICRQLAELMGGGIAVESTVGEGSTFTVCVVFRRQPASREFRPSTPVDLRGLKVLIVDDNAALRDVLVNQIESFSMYATAAGSGEEALELLSDPDRSFDLVLMDWKMQGINGIEAARRIRFDLKLKKTPVVCMISAYAREDLMHQADRTVLDAFLHKPVNQSFLFDTIMGLFGHDEAAMDGGQTIVRPSIEVPDFSGCRVLLAEDMEINRMVAIEWLSSVGLEVETAEDGEEAVAKVGRTRFDAVLMDIQMPRMDGLEATRRIRALAYAEHADVPIIAMTAHALKGNQEACLEAGMNDYVSKPVDPDRLFAALARWLPGIDERKEAPKSVAGKVDLRSGSGASDESLDGIDLPGIDVADGLARANGNTKLYLRMLRNFRDGQTDAVNRVETDMAADRVEDGRRAVHSVKGVAGNIGAKELYDRAAEAERLIADGLFDPAGGVWHDYATALAKVVRGLESLPKAQDIVGAVEGERLSKESVDDLLDDLATQLEDDLGEARKTLENLRPTLVEWLGYKWYIAFSELIDAFDIDGAIAMVEALQANWKEDVVSNE